MALTYLDTVNAYNSGSGVVTLGFTTKINDTYDAYEFHLANLHPENGSVQIAFQVDTTGTSYDQNICSTFFRAKLHEDDSDEEVAYQGSFDQADGDDYQVLCNDVGNEDDETVSGTLTLYAPADDTYVKHFQSRMIEVHESDILMDSFCSGYINQTNEITKIRFAFVNDSLARDGKIMTGKIHMYGVG